MTDVSAEIHFTDSHMLYRTDINVTSQASVTLPCGMRFHERLLLPNLGEEGAVIMTHVASVYNNMPDAVMLLHGGKIHVWHSMCTCVPHTQCINNSFIIKICLFLGWCNRYITGVVWMAWCRWIFSPFAAVKFFSKLNYFIFGYFDPTNILFGNKNIYLLGWLKWYFG